MHLQQGQPPMDGEAKVMRRAAVEMLSLHSHRVYSYTLNHTHTHTHTARAASMQREAVVMRGAAPVVLSLHSHQREMSHAPPRLNLPTEGIA
jgi:hypothetical protein